MSATCTHTDQIRLTELPETVAGCEDWGWCVVDEVAFIVEARV